MTEASRLRPLLGELFALGVEDAQLPLVMLVNLHRTPLRRPLECLMVEASAGVEGDDRLGSWRAAVSQNAGLLLDERYPSLKSGALFNEDSYLTKLVNDPDRHVPLQMIQESLDFGRQTLLGQFLYSASTAWSTYDPLVLLAVAGMKGSWTQYCIDQLEAELALDPAVAQMILDFAGTDKISRVGT